MENQYFIVRCDSAGVFFGKIKERSADEVTMTNVRKLWYWKGACAVEEIAMNGVKVPLECKFTVTIPEMVVANPIQVIPCTDAAVKSINGVKEWKF